MKDDLNTTLAYFLLHDYKKTCEYGTCCFLRTQPLYYMNSLGVIQYPF